MSQCTYDAHCWRRATPKKRTDQRRENGSKVNKSVHVPCSNSSEVRRFQRERIIVFDGRRTRISTMVRMGDGDTSEVDGVSGSVSAEAAAAATSVEAVSARSFFSVTVSLHYYDGSDGGDGKSDDDGGGDGYNIIRATHAQQFAGSGFFAHSHTQTHAHKRTRTLRLTNCTTQLRETTARHSLYYIILLLYTLQ